MTARRRSKLEPPGIHWPLVAAHMSAPVPIVANRRGARIKERLVTTAILLALAAAGAFLGLVMPL